MVAYDSELNLLSTNLDNRFVFPTLESPIRTILKRKSYNMSDKDKDPKSEFPKKEDVSEYEPSP